MRVDLILLSLFGLLQFENVDPKNVTAPFITSRLEQLDGSQIQVRYRAVHWDPIVTTAVFENQESRDYYNHFVLNNVATLRNNVQVAIGTNRLNPGVYQIGIEAQSIDQSAQGNRRADFLISDENNVLMRVPVVIMEEHGIVQNVSIVFTPGVTDRDFVLNALYGNLSLTMKMRFSGVPARSVDLANQPARQRIQPNTSNQQNPSIPASPLNNPAANAGSTSSKTPETNTLPPSVRAAQQRAGFSPLSPQEYLNTVADSQTLGGLANTRQDGSETIAPATASQIQEATARSTSPQPKAGSGAFRAMNLRP